MFSGVSFSWSPRGPWAGERMAAPPARPQGHFSITLRSRSLAQSVVDAKLLLLVDAGSCLQVKFLRLPRSFLFGTNAGATFPTLLFSFRALAATLPRRYPRSPDMRGGLPLYIFAPRGALDISEVVLAPILSPLLRSPFRALAFCCSGDMRRRGGRNFFVWGTCRTFAATFCFDA